jgi:hypothetical protein
MERWACRLPAQSTEIYIMGSFEKNLLIKACASSRSTMRERMELAYAASMWEAGARRITAEEVMLAERILLEEDRPGYDSLLNFVKVVAEMASKNAAGEDAQEMLRVHEAAARALIGK